MILRVCIAAVLCAALLGLVLLRPRGEAPAPALAASSAAPPGEAAAPPPRPAAAPDGGTEGHVGVILPRQAVEVASRGEGRLLSVLVRPGDRVAQNALLATIDARTLKSDQAMANASVHTAQAELRRSEAEQTRAAERLQRVRNAFADRGTSEEDLDRAKSELQIAEARLQAARAAVQERGARLEQTRTGVAETEVRAPFPGSITARYIDAGAMVGRGTAIVRLVSVDDLLVRFAVPEQHTAGLLPGRAVRVRVPEIGQTLSGIVERVAPEVDAASRMVLIEARLEVPEPLRAQILAGRVARVSL